VNFLKFDEKQLLEAENYVILISSSFSS